MELLRPSGASLEIACATYAKAFDILGGDAMIEAARFYAAPTRQNRTAHGGRSSHRIARSKKGAWQV
jgi:hypothetical protein